MMWIFHSYLDSDLDLNTLPFKSLGSVTFFMFSRFKVQGSFIRHIHIVKCKSGQVRSMDSAKKWNITQDNIYKYR